MASALALAILRMADSRRALLALCCCGAAWACAGDDPADDVAAPCAIVHPDVELSGAVSETSGVVFDPRDPDVFWTHNDSGHDAELFAIGLDGATLARMPVRGATNRDWEELSSGPCPEAETCFYIFDTGDAGRDDNDPVEVYRLPVPTLDAQRSPPSTRIVARFPDRHRDVEAAFVLPDGSVYLINKGHRDPIELWRWPATAHGEEATLARVRTLAPRPRQPGDLVTGAAASPDGRWVAVRTYGRLSIYRTEELLAEGGAALTLDLAPLGEPQGEAVALADDGTVILTSESGAGALPPRANWLRCRLP